MRYKTGIWIAGCLVVAGGALWMYCHTESQRQPPLSSSEDSRSEPDESSPSARTTLLSKDAEYPVPVIQLQKELTHDLVMEAASDFPVINDDRDVSAGSGTDAGEKLQTLRRRLSELQALNKQ
ncbi:hypothetical protein [Vibrio salinus]|uniref:hypothetical protein n=1 Tax=Vibrio salinus TaxID=2899784 RepID=UPI001E5D9EA1|nr:hypothetical protein [Vibrio salinus]MCE0494153.1 hypothetical protein [Vibrio salinus]